MLACRRPRNSSRSGINLHSSRLVFKRPLDCSTYVIWVRNCFENWLENHELVYGRSVRGRHVGIDLRNIGIENGRVNNIDRERNYVRTQIRVWMVGRCQLHYKAELAFIESRRTRTQ